ncbi:MAG TPA: nicotinate-nucleotide diphosphorylase [Pirellulales bacterium]|jgi:nicotinate-nucleotide pyrophosphorylase (carboxylating)|nr:nicotinate-nucleotide diphosphorylase [Pirellulales bacterium]
MATLDFRQIEWDEAIEDDCRQLVRLAVREDLDRWFDWTTVALVPEGLPGKAKVVARQRGVIAGLAAAQVVLDEYDRRIEWRTLARDGETIEAGRAVAELSGPARSLLTVERPLLNLLCHLSGIATLTRAYVDAVAGTPARVYDTRKTIPGLRRLEKYAVRCGGGRNHRLGLFDGVLVKDNHLAFCAAAMAPAHGVTPGPPAAGALASLTADEIAKVAAYLAGGMAKASAPGARLTPAQAVAKVREFLRDVEADDPRAGLIVEVEVDTLEQLDDVLPAGPDIVLLDNMSPAQLREAVVRRNAAFPQVQLEASGGIDLATIGEIARTGVERISVGALTHSAKWLDLGLDWQP